MMENDELAPLEQGDDLRSTLESALAEQRAKAPEPAPEAAPVAPVKDDKPVANRAVDGKFATKADDAPAENQPHAIPVDGEKAATPSLPPASWSPQAKALWGKDTLTAQEVAVWKTEAAKREADVEKGFKEYGEYKPIKQYMDMARQSGTTLDKALENYTGLEKLLRTDVFSGVERVLRNVNVDPVAFANAYLARQGVAPQPGQQRQQQAPQFNPDDLINRAKAAAMNDFRAEQNNVRVNAEISAFAADPKNVYFSNVQEAMGRLIEVGFAKTLDSAYEQACKLDPTISQLIQQRALSGSGVTTASSAVPQARAAAKATMGAPSAGLKPGNAQDQTLSIREAAVAALAAQRGRA